MDTISSVSLDNEALALDLGPVETRRGIQSSLGPFRTFPNYRIRYPMAVTEALGELYSEYNRAFAPLVEANREWESDYGSCFGTNGLPVNCVVQIDMVGLSSDFLDLAVSMSAVQLREALRRRIYEIENSLAMYQLLERLFSREGEDSFFKTRFRACLDDARSRFGRPIALLAVTEPKYQAMLTSEFGKEGGETLSDAEVFALSGFDRFFGPEEFRSHVEGNGGRSEYLLYARTSDPIAKLKKPDTVVEHPLLSDPVMRKAIKASALTFNVDAPEMEFGRRINDTKAYMSSMGMAFPVTDVSDLQSPPFEEWLKSRGLAGGSEVLLRAKPLQGTYGCYGHFRGRVQSRDFRYELKRSIQKRGAYVVQPEIPPSVILDEGSGKEYTYIDRNFFGVVGGQPMFLGGFRSLMPCDTVEAREGRNHGNGSTVWAEITCS